MLLFMTYILCLWFIGVDFSYLQQMLSFTHQLKFPNTFYWQPHVELIAVF